VKPDLGNRGLDLEACVPGAPLWAVEAATERTWMGESCIHDVGFWHSQQQLARSNRGVASDLRDLALVGCRIELAEVSENIGWKGKALKNALRAAFGGDQSMGSSLVELYECANQCPPRSASIRLRTCCSPGIPARTMKSMGVWPRKRRLSFGCVTQRSASSSGRRMCRAL